MNSKKGYGAMLFCAVLLVLFQPGCGHKNDDNQTNDMQALLREFDDYAAKAMNDWEIPGMTVAIVRGDSVLFEKAYGVKTKGGHDPVTVNTLFQIGSISKSFTTTLMAMDVSEGKYKWDDKVVNLTPDFQMFDPWVTSQFEVVDLSAQRSGMAGGSVDHAVMYGFGRQHILDSLRFIEPVSSFRSTYAYVNNLFLVDAHLVEKYSGKSFEDNLKERIFTPLNMTHSSLDKASFVNSPDVISLHRRINGRIVVLPMDWKYLNWTYTYLPAGGINSTIVDMENWLRLHFNNGSFNGRQLIKEENAIFVHSAQTVTPQRPGHPGQYYCQGWVHREYDPYPIIWHNGETSGCNTVVALIPQAKVGIVVLSNLNDSQLPDSLAWKFFDLYFDKPKRDWSGEELEKSRQTWAEQAAYVPEPPPNPEPSLPLDDYVGTYYNPVYDEVQVTRNMDQLLITFGPLDGNLFLRHWDGNAFMTSWDLYTVLEDIGLAEFELDGSNTPIKMTVFAFDYDNCGVFERI